MSVDTLHEEKLHGEEAFRGRFLSVQRDQVRLPSGAEASREFIRHPGAVAILALTDDGRLVLERQFRYPLGRSFIEIPAGKIDPDEDHRATAERELWEETGYRAGRWTFLGSAHACIGYSDEVIHYYLAQALQAGERQLDEGEFLEVFTVPLEQALTMSCDGRISDSKSIVGLHWLQAHLRGS